MESFDPITPQGLSISNLFWLELAISAVLLALVLGALVATLVRFRVRDEDRNDAPHIHGNRRLEIIWTATPALTLLVIFGIVVQTMHGVDTPQPDAEQVAVIGHQWWWEYSYPGWQVVSANELHVPVGTPLQMSLRSADVIHSLHVPHVGWMQDLVPGKTNQMNMVVDRAGVYDGTCNQYCGLQHAWMRVRVFADAPEQFSEWLAAQRAPAVSTGAIGEQVFLTNTCVSCHTIRGLFGASGTVGPDLTHVGSRTTLGAGVIDNTPQNLRAWISNPQALKPGVLMPAYQTLSSSDLDALVAYLGSLQ